MPIHYTFEVPKTFYTVNEIINNTNAPRTLDLDQIASNPNLAKLNDELHLFIMKHYHNLFTFMLHHQPYMLKSQFLDLYGYQKGKKNMSRTLGYAKLKELEDKMLIGSKSFYGAEYIYLSYRTYYYFGQEKKVLPIAPGENVLFRHFTRMEDYLELDKKYQENKSLFLVMFCSHQHCYITNTECFFPIKPIQEKDTRYFGEYFPKDKTPKNLDMEFITGSLIKTKQKNRGLWFINEETPNIQLHTLIAFTDELFKILNTRCSLKLLVNDEKESLGIVASIMPIPGTSYITINNLISDIYHIEFLLKICFQNVKTNINFIVMNQDHEREINNVINRITKLRENKKNLKPWQYMFNPENIKIRNTNLFRRLNFNETYESQKEKPLLQ
ncbi:hypothetical protein COE36_27425 [Bacillus cereus]|uniref:hypothetical protein n=1 Tax=Bacillus cereus TaxID=1396 RepID=UPI000BFEA1D7|nr:hypothetical protein [Bacillus cereus]PGY80807.1 hypothetical protein COE36_27425 [Bacillus cereus]